MKRSKFSLSHHKLFTCSMGELVPCGLTEVLPGDTIQQATSMLVRCSPLLAPVMHPVDVRIHHWYVPHRLVWEDFEDFITGGEDGDNASVFPTMSVANPGVVQGSIYDYMGIPPAFQGAFSALPFRAYDLIWNEWYRDQDLQDKLTIDLTSGPDTTTEVVLASCDWEKDYFTSSRPWPEKGPDISIPISGVAPVIGIGKGNQTFGSAGGSAWLESDGSSRVYANWSSIDGTSGNTQFAVEKNPSSIYPNIRADLSAVTGGASIADLREAFALQRYEENRARYGSRFTEYLAFLGVRSSDARLQRPEYLGGGRQTISFSEVLQTAPTTDGDDELGVGNLKGHGIAAMRSNRYRKFFEEHGYVLSLMSVRPKTVYGQGIPRHFNRRIKEDFWQRELQHIGQQEVLNKELYAAHAQPDGVFGYQDRYDEYRRAESHFAGAFRSTLDYWHLGRIFGSAPALNDTFVLCVPSKRVNAVGGADDDTLWIMAKNSIQARRLVARTGKPMTF